MSVVSRVVLFVSSYAPLLVLFSLLESFGPGWPSGLCLYIGIGSTVLLVLLWALLRTQLATDEATFAGARSRDADVMAYVVSYVVPFAAAADASAGETRWALAVFAALIAVLYVRSAVFYVHPLLLLAGIHVYEATRNDVPVIVLTRKRQLRQSVDMTVKRIGPNVYLEARP